MDITAQIESDNLTYVTVETNLPDETNIIVSLVGTGDSDDTGYNTNYKADDSLQIVDGKAVAGPFSNNGVALPFGDYKVEVTVPLAETQPQDVQKVFGKNMRNVRGGVQVLTRYNYPTVEEKKTEYFNDNRNNIKEKGTAIPISDINPLYR